MAPMQKKPSRQDRCHIPNLFVALKALYRTSSMHRGTRCAAAMRFVRTALTINFLERFGQRVGLGHLEPKLVLQEIMIWS